MLVFVFFLFVTVPVVNFLHELGHVFTSRIFGMTNTVLHLGTGPCLFRFQIVGIEINIHLVFFIGALSFSEYDEELQEWKRGIISIGGPLLNVMIALISLLLDVNENFHWELFILFNLWVGIVNMIPFKMKEKHSDGYLFIQTMYRQIKCLITSHK